MGLPDQISPRSSFFINLTINDAAAAADADANDEPDRLFGFAVHVIAKP